MHSLRGIEGMAGSLQLTILVASNAPDVIRKVETIVPAGRLIATAGRGEAARELVMSAPHPELVLLDARLDGWGTGHLLAEINVGGDRRFAIAVIAEGVAEEWVERWRDGVIDDVIPLAADAVYWRLRIDAVLRLHGQKRELALLRDSAALHAQMDALTGVLNRTTLMSMLFRETDRVQRMNTSLCMILFDIDDFGHWNAQLGSMVCDDLLLQLVSRVKGLLRSYDLLGRMGKDEFLVALPGCSAINAVLLAERMRIEVLATPFHVAGRTVRLTACFGIAESHGRSPVVVLRAAEQALNGARGSGPETIQCAGEAAPSQIAPMSFLAAPGEDLLAW